MNINKQLPHEFAEATKNRHHQYRLQVSDDNGTRFAPASWPELQAAEYTATLYQAKGASTEIVQSHCTWNCSKCV